MWGSGRGSGPLGGNADLEPSAQAPLVDALLGPHEPIVHLLGEAAAASPSLINPRKPFEVIDTFVAALSQHLAAAEDVVHPVVRARMSDGKTLTMAQAHIAREMDFVMRQIETCLYGESHAIALPWPLLWDRMDMLMNRHMQAEGQLAAHIVATLSPEEHEKLARRFNETVEREPTRPHPYSPHAPSLSRMAHRFWAFADRALDTMDNRIVPHRPPRLNPKPDSLLTHYLTGTALESAAEPGEGPRGDGLLHRGRGTRLDDRLALSSRA